MAASKPHHDAELDGVKTEGQNKWRFTPRGLNIIWGNDKRYWSLPASEQEPAELLQVCWLEVTGSTPQFKPAPGKSCEVGFTLGMKAGAFGLSDCQVFLMAKVGKKGKYTWKKVSMPEAGTTITEKFTIKFPSGVEENDSKIFFGLYEVWTGKWKGGLLIHSATVELKE